MAKKIRIVILAVPPAVTYIQLGIFDARTAWR
jgi:hypothetical protein